MNSFDRRVLEWCRLHPDDVNSRYFIKCFKESAARKKAERERWRLISKAMLEKAIEQEEQSGKSKEAAAQQSQTGGKRRR
jgi:hypothetical protein